MWLTLLAVCVGLASGLVSGGSVAAIGRARPLGSPLAAVWVGLTALTRWVQVPGARGLFLVANVAALMFCALNIRRLGTALLFGGVALNTLVIALNGSMPYRVSSVISAGLANAASDFPATVQTRPQRPGDLLTVLSDIIPVNAGFIHDVLSAGDILAACGVAWVAYRAMTSASSRLRSTVAPSLPDGTDHDGTDLNRPGHHRPGHHSVIHHSTIRLGEEYDLVDDETDAGLPVATPIRAHTAASLLVPSMPVHANSAMDDSTLQLIVDLTVDRHLHAHRHSGSGAFSSDLMSSVLHGGEELVDLTHGELPGEVFWAERAKQLAKMTSGHTAASSAAVQRTPPVRPFQDEITP